jgi:hypothetical protein
VSSRNDIFDAAHLKLGTAHAIVDVLVMLNVANSLDTLKTGSLTACLLHADELLGEAKAMFSEAQSAQAAA